MPSSYILYIIVGQYLNKNNIMNLLISCLHLSIQSTLSPYPSRPSRNDLQGWKEHHGFLLPLLRVGVNSLFTSTTSSQTKKLAAKT